MAATIIDGKALAAKLKENVSMEAQTLPRKPGLAVVLVLLPLEARLQVRLHDMTKE